MGTSKRLKSGSQASLHTNACDNRFKFKEKIIEHDCFAQKTKWFIFNSSDVKMTFGFALLVYETVCIHSSKLAKLPIHIHKIDTHIKLKIVLLYFKD